MVKVVSETVVAVGRLEILWFGDVDFGMNAEILSCARGDLERYCFVYPFLGEVELAFLRAARRCCGVTLRGWAAHRPLSVALPPLLT
jgi:hypothetical protein